MLGRRVWSERDVQKLAAEFVCVADEVWNLVNTDVPAARFFKSYGLNCPPALWSSGATTKQGLYLMTPDADHLSGHFGRHDKDATLRVLNEALTTWRELVRDKKYKTKPVPEPEGGTWDADGVCERAGGEHGANAALILKVFARDMPGQHQANDGAMKGAFNQTWLDFDEAQLLGFLPADGARKGEVRDAVFRRLAQKVLVDNVRGQTPDWRDNQMVTAKLETEVASVKRGKATIQFVGEFEAGDARHGMKLSLYGEAIYDQASKRFERFELVAIGVRRGGSQFNKRDNDEAESPIGFTLVIEGQDEKKPRRR